MEQEINENTIKKKKGSSFMKNVLILMFAQISVKILGLIYRFVITNFQGFGDTGLGYYSAGYQIYAVLLALSSIGIPSVVAKLVSERLATGDKKGAQRIFKICLLFFTGIGLLLSVGLFFGAESIAMAIFNVTDVKYVMQVLAPAIVLVSASSVMRGYFAGQDDMKPTSTSQILEQFFNCVLSITFVYALIGKDPFIMAAGGNLSTTVAIIINLIYLVFYYKKRKIKVDKKQVSPEKNKTVWQLLKIILVISVPVTISSIVSVVNPLIDTATVSRCIQAAFSAVYNSKEALETFAMSATGILSKIDTLVGLPIAINVAFSTALVPAISAALAKKDKQSASKRMTFSLFASFLIIIPCACGFISLAQPILKLIYPSASDGAGVFMVYCIPMIFIALNQTINGGLYGLNKTYIPAISLVVGAAIKFVMNVVLISNPNIGLYGAPISSIVCQIVAFVICFKTLTKHIKLQIDFKRMLLAPIISGLIMGAGVYGIYLLCNQIVGNTISTITAIIGGVVIYGGAILMMKVLKKEDIMMIPFGTKIYHLLLKFRIYKEELVTTENIIIEDDEQQELINNYANEIIAEETIINSNQEILPIVGIQEEREQKIVEHKRENRNAPKRMETKHKNTKHSPKHMK